MRQDGYYWVKFRCNEEWEICHWLGGRWWGTGEELAWDEDAFIEVDERRLER